MSRVGEYLLQAEECGHAALYEVAEQCDLRAVSEYGLNAAIVVFALGGFRHRQAQELQHLAQ